MVFQMGIIANDRRRKLKEAIDKMCGLGHDFGYLKVDHKLRDILTILHTPEKITAKVTSIRNSEVHLDFSEEFGVVDRDAKCTPRMEGRVEHAVQEETWITSFFSFIYSSCTCIPSQ